MNPIVNGWTIRYTGYCWVCEKGNFTHAFISRKGAYAQAGARICPSCDGSSVKTNSNGIVEDDCCPTCNSDGFIDL